MRIGFKRGKQRELIFNCKTQHAFTWDEFAKFLSVATPTLLDWHRERNLLPFKAYKKLDPTGFYESSIISRLNDNWGRQKGGFVSEGSLKEIKIPAKSNELAEFIGIMLGDGNVQSFVRSKKIATYMVRVAGNRTDEYGYITVYVADLIRSLFGVQPKLEKVYANRLSLVVHSKSLVAYFTSQGLKPGNKIDNQVTIPEWIFQNKEFLKACVRGLIDTDGSIYMAGKWPQICFKNHNLYLLRDFRKALISLGYYASKVTWNKVYISRKSDIQKFYKEIGFSNSKNTRRYLEFFSPVV